MRILALETNPDVIKKRFCHEGECEVLLTKFHLFRFLFAIVKDLFYTFVLVMIVLAAAVFHWPLGFISLAAGAAWLMFVFSDILKAYIDWAYDFLWITTDKLVLLDQTSLLRQEIKPIHIENIGGISTATQFWGLFPFGILRIHLKEGLGGDILTLRYVPHVENVAGTISEVVTRFQRRDPRARGRAVQTGANEVAGS